MQDHLLAGDTIDLLKTSGDELGLESLTLFLALSFILKVYCAKGGDCQN
jgi:hypothetical protein